MPPRRTGGDRPPVEAMTIERVGVEAFAGTRLDRPGRVAVAFLADWCPFCQAFGPKFTRLAKDSSSLLIADVTDLEDPLWERFGVEVVPTVVVFASGKAVFRADGVPGEGLGDNDLEAIRKALHAGVESSSRSAGEPPRRTSGDGSERA